MSLYKLKRQNFYCENDPNTSASVFEGWGIWDDDKGVEKNMTLCTTMSDWPLLFGGQRKLMLDQI